MKTVKEAHESLQNGNIRQYLSNNVSVGSSWSKTSQQKQVDEYKKQLAELQKMLTVAETDLAILILSEQNGWSFFDVSDRVLPIRGAVNEYPPFIGTIEEHDCLFNNNS